MKTKIVLRKKPNKEGLCPLCVRLSHKNKTKYLSLGIKLLQDQFKNGEFTTKVQNFKYRNRQLLNVRSKCLDIIDELNLKGALYDFEDFLELYYEKEKEPKTFVGFTNEIISELKEGNQLSYALTFKDLLNSITSFIREKKSPENIAFENIDLAFLEKYEAYLRSHGNKNSSISIKMRTLRVVFNKALKRNLVSNKHYPFADYKISRLKQPNNKRAFSKEEFRKFKNVDLTFHSGLIDSHKLALFSFYCRGMNFVDMAKLKHENISNGVLSYARTKTKGEFKIKLLPEAIDIIKYFKEKYPNKHYLMPILTMETYTASQFQNRKKKTLKKFNKDLKKIGAVAGIENSITSYVIRHSYATLMKFSGVSTDVISASMGHSDLSVTENYLKSFGDEVLDEANEKLSEL